MFLLFPKSRYVHSISQELHLFLGDSASQLLEKEYKNGLDNLPQQDLAARLSLMKYTV